MKQRKGWKMSCDIGKLMEGLENELWHRWSDRKVGESAELILQPFRHFTYITTHSPTFPSVYLHHSSFSNPSAASPTTQFILQPFFCFSYVTSSSLNSPGEPPMRNRPIPKILMSSAHSPTFPSLHPRHNSFSNPSVTSPTSQLILQPFRRFTYVTAHSPTLPLLHLRHNSFSNPSFASATSQALHLTLILPSANSVSPLKIAASRSANTRHW